MQESQSVGGDTHARAKLRGGVGGSCCCLLLGKCSRSSRPGLQPSACKPMPKRKVQAPPSTGHGPWSESSESEEDAATADGATVVAADADPTWDPAPSDSDPWSEALPCGTSSSNTAPSGIVDLTVPALELLCAAPQDETLKASRTAIAKGLMRQCSCRKDSSCYQKCRSEEVIKLRALFQTMPRDNQQVLASSAHLNVKTGQ